MRAVDHTVERLPEWTNTIRRLYLKDERFRAICEDFALSIGALRRFEDRSDAHLRPEVEDYRAMVRELEDELRSYLAAAGTA